MYGAIIGDMAGSPYEFDRGDKTKDFPMFGRGATFTDDSVMTVAVAEALTNTEDRGGFVDRRTPEEIKKALAASMRKWGKKYPDAGYGARFIGWIFNDKMGPYNSFGNGSAMRVSAAGWLYDSIEKTREAARLTSEVTHDHPEGIKGAEAVASAIFLARNGASKKKIKSYITKEFGYDLSRTCDEIRPGYHHVESCQETVPEAITAFLEGRNFEDVIRTAVSLGGDCDTLTCIAGSIAEAFYPVPNSMIEECKKRLPAEIIEAIEKYKKVAKNYHEGTPIIICDTEDRHAETAKPQNAVFFWKVDEENGCFANWYSGKFILDGTEYRHVEQYMMAQKAKLFHDDVRYAAIMSTADPGECKALGKQVAGFDPKVWDEFKYDIVKTANRAKYDQDPDLKAKLLATGNAVMAEANPADMIWGIGLDAKAASEMDPAAWPGQNLLGKILMELRKEYSSGE